MVARKETNGTWTADFYQDKKRIRKKGFLTKSAAIRFENDTLATPSEQNKQTDSLMDLVDAWYKLHGFGLKDAKYRYSRTKAIAERLGNPPAKDFNALEWANYRTERLKTVTPETINHEQRYISAVFSESHLLNKCIHDDERHNWKQLRIVLYIVNFKYDKRFVKKRIVGTFVECRSIPSPFIEIPQNK